MKIGQVVSEEKLLNNVMISNMYTAQGQGKITLTEQNFDCNLKLLLLYFNHILYDLGTSAIFVLVCVFTALKGHSIYNLFIFARRQGLAKLSSSMKK